MKATVNKVFKFFGMMEEMCPLSLGHFALKSQKCLSLNGVKYFPILKLKKVNERCRW